MGKSKQDKVITNDQTSMPAVPAEDRTVPYTPSPQSSGPSSWAQQLVTEVNTPADPQTVAPAPVGYDAEKVSRDRMNRRLENQESMRRQDWINSLPPPVAENNAPPQPAVKNAGAGGGGNYGTPSFKHDNKNIYTNVGTGRPNEVHVSGGPTKQSPGEQLESRIRAMLPGATTQQVQSMMMTVAQHRFNAEAQRDAQNQVTPAKPTYHTVNPGQTMLEMGPHGTKEVYRAAPKDTAETLPWKEQVKNNSDMYKDTHHEYLKNWDDITKNIPDEPHPVDKYLTQKQKALHEHNTQYFTSLGVKPDLAAVHESRELFLKQMLKPGETMSAEDTKRNLADHALLMKERRRQMSKKYGNTLNFTPGR